MIFQLPYVLFLAEVLTVLCEQLTSIKRETLLIWDFRKTVMMCNGYVADVGHLGLLA